MARYDSYAACASTAFDEYAPEYDAWFLENRCVLESEVLLLEHFLARPGKALSVGCGSGQLLFALKQFGYTELTGIDTSAEQVELARKIVPGVVQEPLLRLETGLQPVQPARPSTLEDRGERR